MKIEVELIDILRLIVKALKDDRVAAAVGLLDDMIADLERRGIGTENGLNERWAGPIISLFD